MAEPTNHNDAAEVAPSTVDKQAPSVSEEHAPSTEEPVATDIPSANAPDPTSVNPEVNPNAAEEKKSLAVSNPDESGLQPKSDGQADAKKSDAPPKRDKPAAKAEGDKPAAKAAKKEKAPAVEDKPFIEFIQQHYLPTLKTALANQGVQNLNLTFEKQKVPIAGYNQSDECWQVIGRWENGTWHQFNIYFPQEDIQGQRAFSCNEGSKPSTLEPFLIDERKVTLDLMVFGLMQRLNGQKWLARN